MNKPYLRLVMALAGLFLVAGNIAKAAENISPSQAADKDGSFISKTRESIPPFPSTVRGFYYDPGKDFWGKPFEERGSTVSYTHLTLPTTPYV